MILIILVIGRIVLMKRKSTDSKQHNCTASMTISVKDHKTDDVISLDSDLNSTDRANLSNMPGDDVSSLTEIENKKPNGYEDNFFFRNYSVVLTYPARMLIWILTTYHSH